MKPLQLRRAYDDYWNSQTPREHAAAYHEIKLFGGKDGFPNQGPWRSAVIRALRRLAYWLEA